MKIRLTRLNLVHAAVLLLAVAGITAADQPAGRAVLQPAKERSAAPELTLKDSSGKTMKLKKYRGKWSCLISGPHGVTDA